MIKVNKIELYFSHTYSKTLGFDFCAVTPLDYLNRFIRALQTTDPQVTKLARFLS